MIHFLRRSQIIVRDWVRYHWLTRLAFCATLEVTVKFSRITDSNSVASALVRLTRAARGTPHKASRKRLEGKIRRLSVQWSPTNFDWDAFFPGSGDRSVPKSIVLKAPLDNGERGVIFVAFEECWIRLLRHANIPDLARDFDIVLSPSWSPPHDLALLIAGRVWPRPIFSILSNASDLSVFPDLSPNIYPIPLLASSWINPALFPEASSAKNSKKYDVIMIANFAKYKRHFALFHAMRSMPKKTRVLLVGRAWDGRTQEMLNEEARIFGVESQIEIREANTDVELSNMLLASHTSVIMSLGEGSCVAVAESLVSGIPVALLEGARVGSSAFLSQATGRFLRPSRLAEDLEKFIEDAEEFAPRAWMLENGKTCLGSTKLLCDFLRDAAAGGCPWTEGIAPMHWRPNARYLNTSDALRFAPVYDAFDSKYGVRLERPTESH